MQTKTLGLTLVGLTVGLVPVLALTTVTYEPGGGPINISGATLFAPFYPVRAGTNDFINADNDFTSCIPAAPKAGFFDSDCDTFPDDVDQLAVDYACSMTTFWTVNIRGVGSGNGLAEFRDFQLCGTIPDSIPAEGGWFNRAVYASGGSVQNLGCGGQGASGTPVVQTTIDIGVMDVPTPWFVTVAGTPAPDRQPGIAGYGLNLTSSWPTAMLVGGQSNQLKGLCSACGPCLNIDHTLPPPLPANTVYDNITSWVPIAFISNRGTGIDTLAYSELQYLFATGRLPSGENIQAATRDAGSGTRNGSMNSICLDPSYGRGDNIGKKHDSSSLTKLGPSSQFVNCGGSSRMEEAVQYRPLAIGYTGVMGAGRAADDATAGKYEILSVIKDSGSPTCGAGTPVRPTLLACIDNDDPCTGYQIGGPQTFATLGDPNANRPMGDPKQTTNTPMTNQNAAEYINNIVDSIEAFSGNPGLPETYFMPGEWLADSFILPAGIDALPGLTTPCVFSAQTPNATLRQYMLDNNDMGFGGDCPDYGLLCAGLVPSRTAGTYTDGTGDGRYFYKDSAGTLRDVVAGKRLSARNRLAGDFNDDGARNIGDIPKLMEAVDEQLDFDITNHGGCYDSTGMTGDYLIVTIVGDFNGDGSFDAADVRYFADGLAMDNGQLDRKQGFIDVDNTWNTLKADDNYFDTTPATGTYAPGDARGDVTGSATGTAPGAAPQGHDSTVDILDVEYVKANIGNWSSLTNAISIDLSADMNGDLAVDCADVVEIVENILDTKVGDLDLDGNVDTADEATLQGNLGITSGATYAQGDLDCDGDVDGDDLAILQANLPMTTQIVASHVFYNASYYDGNSALLNASDNTAIDGSKALLVSGTSSFANYTGCTNGITGLMFDVANASPAPVQGDFAFDAMGYASTGPVVNKNASVSAFAVDAGAGVSGSDRVKVAFTAGSIVNTWLRVTVGTGFGLDSPAVLWIGNMKGESNTPASGNALVNATDFNDTKNPANAHGPFNRAPVDDWYDVNKDSLVNATDLNQIRAAFSGPFNSIYTPITK